MNSNASDMYATMHAALALSGRIRQSDDDRTPTPQETVEAKPGCQFELYASECNLVAYRSVELRWAIANVLHFFSGREEAGVLRRYCKHADRFLDEDDRWLGAYGAIALLQFSECAKKLRLHPMSRRAIVSMGDLAHDDINRPACWSFLHFLNVDGVLDLLVYQRSMNLAVMPYDCVLLTNVLLYMSTAADLSPGSLRWTFGSLHAETPLAPLGCVRGKKSDGIVLPADGLDDPEWCWGCLNDPKRLPQPFSVWLSSSEEVRT